MFNWFRKKSNAERTAQQFYGSIVAQARKPEFYTRFAVEDSLEGRFDLITLHMFLALRALKQHGEAGKEVSAALVETFFEDLDNNLREMGVGDLTVPKKMRKFADAFYGRASAYDAAVESGKSERLYEALSKNIYGSDGDGLEPTREAACTKLAAYVQTACRDLETRSFDKLLQDGLSGLHNTDAQI